jgi:pyruvate dehydrogenase E2 component (dihydrolipoamide acetyltransferase)
MAEFRMPSLGADMEDGTLVQWLIKPGDRVKRGDIVAVVETQKGAIDVEIFASGTVERLLVPQGAEVPVGTVLALLNGPGAVAAPVVPAPAPVTPAVAPLAPAPSPPPPSLPVASAPVGRARISPLARRLAENLGVDLAHVQGTGPHGTIDADDVQRAAAAVPLAAPPKPAAAIDRQAGMRAAIAAVMARSKREIPHYYLQTEIDMRCALAWLEDENRKRPVTTRLLPAVLLLRAVALAAREVPEVNGFWVEGTFRPSAAVHLGVAITLPHGGLIAPAIHDAADLRLDALMPALRDLVTRARASKLRSSEIADATISVTNLGERAVSVPFGVIYPPQVAMVGFGPIRERPWAVEGMLTVRPIVSATLAADHRASVGHRGDQFLAAIGRLLQRPEEL